MQKIVITIQRILCISPLFFLASLLILFYYGHGKNQQATTAKEIEGTEMLILITNYLFFLCVAIIPFWLIVGIADLLDKYKKPNYIRIRHVGTFVICIIVCILAFEIVEKQTSVDVIGWLWD